MLYSPNCFPGGHNQMGLNPNGVDVRVLLLPGRGELT